jgi:glucose/arabinose dehydrogenase
VPSATAVAGYTLTEIVPTISGQRGLGLYPIPGQTDAAILLTQAGIMYRVSLSGSFEPTIWGNLIDRVITSSTEEGLLGLAFAPDYPSDPRVYVYYNRPPSSPAFRYREVLSRFDVVGDLDEGSEEVLISLDDRGYYHNGGQLAFGPDGKLYLSIGDEGYQQPPIGPTQWLWDNAQDLTTLFGKVIRIDVSGDTGYTVPADNPFRDGNGPVRDEIWACGFRNPWRFSFDPATGDMWLGDVGWAKNEEINIIEKGANYGWPYREGSAASDAVACNTPCDIDDFTDPVAYYCQRAACATDDCVIVAGFVYHGEDMPELEGWYIFADWCSGIIRALDPANPSAFRVLYDAVAPWTWLSSLGLLPDGEIAVVMRDDYDGSANTRVFRLGHAP